MHCLDCLQFSRSLRPPHPNPASPPTPYNSGRSPAVTDNLLQLNKPQPILRTPGGWAFATIPSALPKRQEETRRKHTWPINPGSRSPDPKRQVDAMACSPRLVLQLPFRLLKSARAANAAMNITATTFISQGIIITLLATVVLLNYVMCQHVCLLPVCQAVIDRAGQTLSVSTTSHHSVHQLPFIQSVRLLNTLCTIAL